MDTLLVLFIIMFAAYGFITAAVEIYRYFKNSYNCDSIGSHILVTVKNQQEHVENIIRSIAWKTLKTSGGCEVMPIVVLDLGSEDDTMKILKILEKEYEFVHVTDSENYIDLIKTYNEPKLSSIPKG